MRKTRTPLLTTLLMFILCTTILVGATTAYFTETVQVSGNVVQSGNLKAEMYWTENLVPGENNEIQWIDASKETADDKAIFSYEQWEPGFTAVRFLQIRNAGRLAFQYQLNVLPQGELIGKANLMDAIDVYYGPVPQQDAAAQPSLNVKDYATFRDFTEALGLERMGTLSQLNAHTREHTWGVMLPSVSTPNAELPAGVTASTGAGEFCIVLHMQEDAGNEYQQCGIEKGFVLQLTATQYTYEKDSFGHDYDAEAVSMLPVYASPVTVTADITGKVSSEGVLTEAVTLSSGDVSAIVPAGAQITPGATSLTLRITPMALSGANLTLGQTEETASYDVHVEGIDPANTLPLTITMGEVLPTGLNMGNYRLHHVENGETVKMNYVASGALEKHNDFKYDPATGFVTVAMAQFSEVAVVAEPAKWEGEFDYTWYTNAAMALDGEAANEYIIANADQLAGFGAIVGGMNGQTQDSFAGKTVKLIADIDLGDAEENNVEKKIFYPIGYYNSEGTYEKTGTAITSGFKTFEGTFDGQGHTISNIYQNTWEMKGDNNYYDAALQYYRDGMGLFGKVYGGTVKNLTVNNFKSDGEFTTTGVIAAYADGAIFENIAITDCNPRVYNIGNGGIVGCVGWYAKDAGLKTTFTNITVDNSNKISALWGSWDVACGGLVGQYYPTSGQTDANSPKNAGIEFVNCHVSAQIDVYNDVCANYQYYAYRYAGMMIGSIRENETINGRVYPKMDGITASGCTVNFGDWNDYYYCELVANSLASYTHDHQMSRLTQVDSVDQANKTITVDGKTTAIPTSGRYNYVVVNGEHATEHATCYHFVDGKVWNHDDAGTETVDGVEGVLKEDKQHIYLEFGQLFTGYGWGVTSKGISDFNGIDTMGITSGEYQESVVKFEDNANEAYTTESKVVIGDLFTAIPGVKPGIDVSNVQVFVSPVGDDSTAGGTYTANATDWTQGTLTFSGVGKAQITITDYYFCKPTTIEVAVTERQSTEKFETKFTGDFLYRVGNQNTVALGSLFAAKEDVTISNSGVWVSIEKVDEDMNVGGTFTANTSEWEKGTIQFSGTGVVKVTITDKDYCIPTELILEVVDAKNITSATSATDNNVVLLNNTSGSFTVSNDYTFYGNGFKVTLPTTVQSKYSAGYVGYVTLTGGNLDNVQIEGPVYPEMYIYRDQAKDSSDDTKANYFYNSVFINGGNCTISNSYISGSRTALCIRGGNNVTVENSTLSGGAYANLQIAGASTVTLRDLTTVQIDVPDSYSQGKTAHGLGIAVDSAVVDVYIEGELNQLNWLNEKQWNSIVPSTYQSQFPDFFTDNTFSKYWHYLNGGTDRYVNMAFIFACNWDISKIHDNRATVDYSTCNATIAGVSGGVYSKVNSIGGNAITDVDLADPGYTSSGFNPVAPIFSFDNTANNDADDEANASDTYCVYDESSGTLKIGVTGNSKTLDLSGISITKADSTLDHTVYLNGTPISGNSVTINVADGTKQTLSFKAATGDAGYDNEGNPIEGNIEYTWTVTVEIAVLTYPSPTWNMGGDYTFDTSNCYYAYYQTSQGYGEAVPIYEGVKVNYYNKSGTLVELDLSGTITLPTGSNNSNANAFTYTLPDGSTLTMKFISGWKSGATTHQFTAYNNKAYIYPQSLDNDNYVREKTTNQDFDVKITYNFTDPNGQSTGEQSMQWYNAKASNGSVSTVQWKTFDSTNGKEPSCLTLGTPITLADSTQKPVENLAVGDMIMVFNHISGEYEAAPVIFNNHMGNEEAAEYDVLHLQFANGVDLGIVASHGFYDMTLMKYVYITYDNYQDFIGHEFYYEDGTDANKRVMLENAYIATEVTRIFCPVSYFHMNSFANGFLNTPNIPGDITGLVNYFEYDDNLKYNEEAMQRDIETYGLYTYDDFKDYISEDAYRSSPAVHLKVAVGKGMITFEQILDVIEYLLAGSLIQ